MKLAKSGLLICTAIILTACGSMPEQRKQEVRSPSAPEAAAPAVRPEPVASQTAPGAPQASLSVPKPGSGAYLEGDGPGEKIPANLDAIPDAAPQAEPLHAFANRPYVALGTAYTPLTSPGNYRKRGIASWYGKKFHGQRTSSGETYNMYAMTAAHPTLPIPSYARVTNVATNKSVVVRINDRGPFLHDRIIDLSYTAAHKLGIIGNGSSEVEVESLAPDSILAAPNRAEPVKVEPLESAPGAGGNVYLQIGAFKSQQSAENFLMQMRVEFEGSGKQVVLYPGDDLVRVHVGPYADRDAARTAAEELQARLGFKPIVSLH